MSPEALSQPLFQHGRVVLSPGVVHLALNGSLEAMYHLNRHLHGDWGQVRLYQGLMNEDALKNDKSLVSRYTLGPQRELWIFTRGDRSVTTLILPEERDAFQAELTE